LRGEIVISREKARRMTAWKKMEKVFETQEELTGYITGRVKGGYICQVDGLPTFMPASQIDLRPLKKIDHLMNIPVKVIATRIDKQRGNVCTSRRAVLEKSKNAEIKEALKNIKEGDIIENAKVKATTDWGIFLDINGLDALCHVSDISYGRVKKPSDLVTIGQSLKVRITKIDSVTNRISASVKALTEDPYADIEKKYKVGKIYDGVCTKLMQYGAFVRLQEGVEGLIHNSELSWTNKNIEPSKILSVSQSIKVTVKKLAEESSEELKVKLVIIKQLTQEAEECKFRMANDKKRLEGEIQLANEKLKSKQNKDMIKEREEGLESEKEKKLDEELRLAKKEIEIKDEKIKKLKKETEQEKNESIKSMKRMKDELLEANQKIQETNMNVNELVSELRGRGEEIVEKDKEIYLLKQKTGEALATVTMLEDNLQQQRDETVKAKNEIKLAKQQHQENKQKSPIKEQEELRRSIKVKTDLI
jgi:small subunit ribosomal protein S1